MYKNDKEAKLRHQIHLSDLSAVAFLKDPKHKRDNVFGLFSPSKNFHLQAPTLKDAQEWVELIRKDARLEEEEEEMFLASPLAREVSPMGLRIGAPGSMDHPIGTQERFLSSSPETFGPPAPGFLGGGRRESNVDSGTSCRHSRTCQTAISNECEAPRWRAITFQATSRSALFLWAVFPTAQPVNGQPVKLVSITSKTWIG